MLQKQTVDPATLGILKDLSSHPILKKYGFGLAGGTSLALRLGHRISIDLDFFTLSEFNPDDIRAELNSFHPFLINESQNTLSVAIKDVKIEFIRHNYPLINELKDIDGVKFYSIEDVSAMKLNAIINRGSKKDFFDLYELLRIFSISEIVGFYQKKYGAGSVMMLLKSLVYFNDADAEPNPVMLDNVTWQQVKSRLEDVTNSLL